VGIITAKEIHTSIVTSSVLFESGSTIFGNTSDDTHQITGSVGITGSLTLNNDPVVVNTTFNSFTSSANGRLNSIETSTSSLNSFTSSANGRLSSIEGVTGSITLLNTYTGSNNTVIGTLQTSTSSLNSFTSSIDTTIKNKLNSDNVISGSAQVIITGTTGYSNFSSSIGFTTITIENRVGSLETESGSIRTDFNSYTSSNNGTNTTQNNRLTAIETSTGSLNTFTSSASGRLNSLESTSGALNTYTSSANGRLNSIETSTGSLNSFSSSTLSSLTAIHTSTGSLNTFSSSTLTRLTNLESASSSIRSDFNSYTSSANGRLSSIETSTGSLNTFSSSTLTRLTAIETSTSSLNSYTSSNTTNINAIHTATASLNSFSSSADGRLTSIEGVTGSIAALNTYTGSNNTAINALNSYTSSNTTNINAIHTATSSLNSYTSSNTTNINAIHTATSSLNSFTSSASGRLTALETASSSLNSYTSSNTTAITALNSFTTSFNTAFGLSGANVTVKGNLTVQGSTTQVDSTTVNIGDNIIQLNGTGATNAGIVVRDATSPTLTSGSFLWDSTNDKWVAGPLGSEDEVVLKTASQALTNKTISGGSNTLSNIGNSSLTNSSITIAGTSTSLGGSITAATILTSTGVWSGSAQLPSGVVSGSAQVIANLPSGTVSGSSQVLAGTTIHSGAFFNGISVVSGSGQISFNGITDKPTLVSGSSQVLNGSGVWSGSAQLPSGVVSGSSQITFGSISSIPSGLVSGSSQITFGSISSIPSGLVSGSSQIAIASTSGFGTYLNQAVLTTSTPTFDQVITSNNGNGTNFRLGDDTWIGDINVANTFRVTGLQDATQGYIVFGNSNATALGRSGTGALTYGGNTIWHAGNDGSGTGLDADLLDGSHASAFSPVAGSSSITTVGTISSGTWNGSSISTTYTDAKVTSVSAGTGISVNATTGAVTVTNTGTLTVAGTANQVLINGGTAAANGNITLSLPQSLGTGSSPTFAAITVGKSGTDSTITFPAQTNDPGYIKHYESNNTAIMYFNVSDDTNDEFHFGYSADASTFRLRADGVVLEGTWQGSAIGDSYISSASNWNTAYNKRPSSLGFTSSTVTLTLGDGSTVTASVPTFNQNTTGNAGYATTAGALTSMNISQFTNNSGYITSSSTISGAAGRLSTRDLRTIAPNSENAAELRFGFTSFANNNTSPWADYLHLRSYSDGSGGADNLVMFSKSGIGMRIYQQTFGSGTAYSSYADVLHSSNYNSYSPTLTGTGASGTWGINITGNAATLGNISASGFWQASGSWGADLTSNGYTRQIGLAYAGGEFVILTSSGQISTLIDGSYFAGEQGGFYSMNTSNQFSSRVGFNRDSSGNASFNASIVPTTNGTLNLGSSSARWNTVFTSDLSMSNGIGDYTIVEGEEDLFIYNNKTNKVFKFLLQEVDSSIVPAKKI
jgi:hypothetical protein